MGPRDTFWLFAVTVTPITPVVTAPDPFMHPTIRDARDQSPQYAGLGEGIVGLMLSPLLQGQLAGGHQLRVQPAQHLGGDRVLPCLDCLLAHDLKPWNITGRSSARRMHRTRTGQSYSLQS